MTKRVLSSEVEKFVKKEIIMCGWVATRRDHGGIIFVDLRDRWGITQLVFDKKKTADAVKLGPEDVIQVRGIVKKRPEGLINPKIVSGKVELHPAHLEVISQSKTPPFEINDTSKIAEEVRMTYRYLDIRTARMTKNLVLRHRIIKFIRDYLSNKDFIEVETPILTKSTPEGARDFLVPSRLHPGSFYALPQSPQQLKQLLMVAGIDKYFQIARCFRDEDPRGDRQSEFTQLDLEMSFVEQNDILDLIEPMYIEMIKEICPQKKITKIPFPRLAYDEVMNKYQSDKPDLRKDMTNPDELAFAWILDWPMFSYDAKEKRWDPHHHIFTSPKKEDLKYLETAPEKVRSWQHDLVLNGSEIGGGSIRITDPKIQEKVLELVGISREESHERFGHILKAFEYGVPPHGGIAPGIDRLVMILANEKNIREVIAYPKTGDGRDLMMKAPSKVTDDQLDELKIQIKNAK